MSRFSDHVDQILAHKSKSKGYDGGKGQLWKLCNTLPHPLGEIVYKVIRYNHQRNPEDLVKIAGWAQLLWEEHCADGQRTVDRDIAVEDAARPADQGLVTRITHHRAGDAGSDSRGARRREPLPPKSGLGKINKKS